MERDEMPKTLCRSGCGFYGSSATDGLCSICFKDALKKKCVPTQASTGSASGASTPIIASGTPAEQQQPAALTPSGDQPSSTSSSSSSPPSTTSVTASAIIDVVTQSLAGPSIEQPPEEEEEEKKPTKIKNRCDTCKKKVGLTGFDCRCGGLFCSLHRYSDKHDCSYNYREQGAAEIRRNNPQIMGQKINKI